jgi:hypothetical protein
LDIVSYLVEVHAEDDHVAQQEFVVVDAAVAGRQLRVFLHLEQLALQLASAVRRLGTSFGLLTERNLLAPIPLTLYPRRGSRDISDIPSKHPHHQPINVPTAGVQTFSKDYPQGERAITHHAGPVQIGEC